MPPFKNNQWETTDFFFCLNIENANKKCIQAAALLGQCGTTKISLKKKIKLQINTNQGNSLHDAIKILNSTLWKQTTEN